MSLTDTVLTDENEYDKVTYVPDYVNGNAGHKDCKQGVLIPPVCNNCSSVKVLYCENRTIQLTSRENLVWG